jgi:hypothetical protein
MPILADPFPTYQPAMRIISDIIPADEITVIITTFDHQYIAGTIVRLDIPRGHGAEELNQFVGTVIVDPAAPDAFGLNVDSRRFQPFRTIGIPWPDDQQYPQVVPVGEDNSILTAATRNVLPY